MCGENPWNAIDSRRNDSVNNNNFIVTPPRRTCRVPNFVDVVGKQLTRRRLRHHAASRAWHVSPRLGCRVRRTDRRPGTASTRCCPNVTVYRPEPESDVRQYKIINIVVLSSHRRVSVMSRERTRNRDRLRPRRFSHASVVRLPRTSAFFRATAMALRDFRADTVVRDSIIWNIYVYYIL